MLHPFNSCYHNSSFVTDEALQYEYHAVKCLIASLSCKVYIVTATNMCKPAATEVQYQVIRSQTDQAKSTVCGGNEESMEF